MENKIVKCGKLNISNKSSFTLIAGPCQLENEEHALNVAIKLKEITNKLNLGLIFSALSPDGDLPEIIELKNHPWFIGVQFHPEFKSRPFTPHPLFSSFVKAAETNKRTN